MSDPHSNHYDVAEAVKQRQRILTQAKNQTYRALVSLVAALAKATSGPREALEIVKGEIANIEKDILKAEKKAARREAKA